MSESRWLLIKAEKAVLSPETKPGPAVVLVDRTTGKIEQVATGPDAKVDDKQDVQVVELANGQVLMAGLVDAHGTCHGSRPDMKQIEFPL